MKYSEAIAYLDSLQQSAGMRLGLETMKELLDGLGRPERGIRLIQVAGTNGKGQTAAGIARILTAAGIRCGLFLSPVVFSFAEQITVDGEEIPEEAVAHGLSRIAAVAEGMREMPTAFEQLTALALLHFRDSGCEYAVLEVGLGGDADATSAVEETVLSVITPIGLDHCRVLGNTIREIAGHKAGIIREGVPVVSMGQDEEAMEAIYEAAEQKHAALTIVDPAQVRVVFADKGGMVLYYREQTAKLPLHALWQAADAALAWEAALLLKGQDARLDEEAIRRGLMALSWPGRFEVLPGEPEAILDGAHNPAAARRLKEALVRRYERAGLTFIFGVLADKDYTEEIQALLGRAQAVYTVTPPSPRALPADALARAVKERFPLLKVKPCESMAEAVDKALREKTPVVVCGSLTILKEAKEALTKEMAH